VRGTASQTHGVSGRTHNRSRCRFRPAVKTLSIVYSTNGATINNASTVVFAQALLVPFGASNSYVPNYGAPNVFRSGQLGRLDERHELGRHVQLSSSRRSNPTGSPRCKSAITRNATSLAPTNTPPGAGVDSYSISSNAYPPSYTTSSLTSRFPAFRRWFALGTSIVTSASRTSAALERTRSGSAHLVADGG